MTLPPPPSRDKDLTGPAWQKWFSLIKENISNSVVTSSSALWSSISKAGSRLTDIETRNHEDLQNLNTDIASHLTAYQLGELTNGNETSMHLHDHTLQNNLNSTDYYHLTNTEYIDLTDAGDSALHYHASDRARANHTGTQSADTITDGTINKVYTATEKTRLANTSGTNTGDRLVTGLIGYDTGAGGAATQITSRSTGVTLNNAVGGITLFSDAGTAAYTTFTVTNSLVSATDIIAVSVKSATNVYLPFITEVNDGSFKVTFNTTGGTATDAPVFNFAIINGVIA